MIHHRESLTLRFESCDYLLAVHSRLDNFQRHFSPDWLQLLRVIHNPHSTLANLSHQPVGSDKNIRPSVVEAESRCDRTTVHDVLLTSVEGYLIFPPIPCLVKAGIQLVKLAR